MVQLDMKVDITRGENGEIYLPFISHEKGGLWQLTKNTKSLDEYFQKVVDDNFWGLIN